LKHHKDRVHINEENERLRCDFCRILCVHEINLKLHKSKKHREESENDCEVENEGIDYRSARNYDDKLVGKHVYKHTSPHNTFGFPLYFNTKFKKYKVVFSDDSEEYLSEDMIRY